MGTFTALDQAIERHNAAIRPELEQQCEAKYRALLKASLATFYVDVVDKIDPDLLAATLHAFHTSPGPQRCNDLACVIRDAVERAVANHVAVHWEPQTSRGDYVVAGRVAPKQSERIAKLEAELYALRRGVTP